METRDVVQLGGHEYVARALPIGKLKRVATQLAKELGTLAESPAQTTDEAIIDLISHGSEGLETFLRAFVPELPEGVMDDEEDGPTIPEVVEAIRTIARLNRFDTLKGVASPLGQVLQSAASRSSE